MSSQAPETAAQAVATSYRSPDSTSGTLTSWIPLVTPYSVDVPGCSTQFWQHDPDSDYVAWDPGFGINVNTDLRFVPKAATTVWDQNRLGSNCETVVSIGPIACPNKFSQVATSVKDESMTMVACCPFEYKVRGWKQLGDPGQCYSEAASGEILTVYTSDTSMKTWAAVTRQLKSSTTVVRAHINGWIFAEQTQTPAVPTVTDTEFVRPECSYANDTRSAIILAIGVLLAVVGLLALAAGMLVMRGSRTTLQHVVQSAIQGPNSRLPLLQGPYHRRPIYQPRPSPGGPFLPPPARARQRAPPPLEKEPQETRA